MTGRKKKEQSRAAHDPNDRDRVLWVNVVLQAIKDATEGSGESGGRREMERRQARLWFDPSNPDFIEVCHLAHLDPDATCDKARRAIKRYDAIIASGEKYRVDRGEKPKTAPRAPKVYTYNGQTRTLSEWATILGVSVSALEGRLRNHPVENALSPSFKRKTRQFLRNPKGSAPKLYTINGVSKTLAGWILASPVSESTVMRRLAKGMTLELALKPQPNTGRAAAFHTVNGVSKTLHEWADHAGITYAALIRRMKSGRTLAEAVAMPKGRWHDRGVVSNFEASGETGARGTAQEIPEIDFSQKAENP